MQSRRHGLHAQRPVGRATSNGCATSTSTSCARRSRRTASSGRDRATSGSRRRSWRTSRREARAPGLWNLFLPDAGYGPGLSNLDYAPLCEQMGGSPLLGEATNCSAPDTGNMEILAQFGTETQRERGSDPLLDGEIRSCFAMTEPWVAS